MTSTNGQGHTSGPWAATTRKGSWDWVVYSVADPNIEICQTFHDGTEFNEVGEANAHLIAAAPDLLEACKGLLAKYDFGDDLPDDHPIVAARAALSRVSGEGR